MKIPFGKCLFLLVILVFGSCISDNNDAPSQGRQFFDARDYFQKESERLNMNKDSVAKILFINDTRDVLITKVDFKKELDAFVKSNINKSSLLDKYTVDSVYFSNQQLKKETYTAIDTSLRTRNFTVEYDSLGIEEISIINISSNLIIGSTQSLRYRPDKVYSITNVQETIGSGKTSIKIEVSNIRKKD